MNDKSETLKIEQRLVEATKNLHKLAPRLGAAKQIIEFSSDMRKNLVAKFQRRYIDRGESVAGSEAFARSDPLYIEALKPLEEQITEAYRVEAEWKATMCSFEAGRSLLAMNRESMRVLEG